MQYPQYSFRGNQSSPRVPSGGYSVLQNNSRVDDSQLNNSRSTSQDSAITSQQPQRDFREDAFQGETHNFSDQPTTTWQWRSQGQNSEPALPIQEAPRANHVPAHVHSFAPPVDLGRLQRVDRPQIQQHFSSDMYKSPIDRPYIGKARKTTQQLNETNNSLDEATTYFKDQSGQYSTMPERDNVTEAKEFMSSRDSDRALFVEPSKKEATTGTGRKLIVLRSPSPQKLAEPRAKKPPIKRPVVQKEPDAQLLTPNFESYVGSPALDTTRDAYQDETQWKAYAPEPEVVDLPPPAIFESLPVVAAQPPAVEYTPPAPVKPAFEPVKEFVREPVKEFVTEPVKEFVALPEPPATPAPAPAPEIKESLFQPDPTPVVVKGAFTATSEKSFGQFSVPKVKSTERNYRFERYETDTDSDVGAQTTAMTVAHTTPVAQPVASNSGWLSPWWMLVCLIPLAMYLLKRRGSEYDEYSYEYDEVDDHPRLPQEMIDRPGYSKSDAVYGETDEYFATEQHFSKAQHASVAERIPMAAHLRVAGKSYEDLEDTACGIGDNTACEVREGIEHEVRDNTGYEIRDDSSCEIRENTACEVREDIEHEVCNNKAYEVRDETACEVRDDTRYQVRDEIAHEIPDAIICEVRDETACEKRDDTACEVRKNNAYEMRDGTACEAREDIKYEVLDSTKFDEFDETSFNELDNAAHAYVEGTSFEDLEDIFPEETVTTNSIPVTRFANSNSVQTEVELEGDDSPNFRSQAHDARRSEEQVRVPITAPSVKSKRKKRRNRKKGRR